ncbi:MAG: shikimate kinase [Lachnospiraceae bacterium]|nr:shikimate kinase [Lachnospiraceae bacterium]MBQ9234507.1 shikimate kinase [Lachnospiraceae bacterium]
MLSDKIVLVGFMGSGKSSVGKELSKRLGIKLLDSDTCIEMQEKKSINDIFNDEGEESFRDMESDFLRKLSLSDESFILSTGGGMPCFNDNAKLIKEVGVSVYLMASPDSILERLNNDTSRPLLKEGNKLEKIKSLLSKREDFYKNAADIVIKTDGKSVEEIADEILGEIY